MRATETVRQWVDERFDIEELLALARHKTVPMHRFSIWYYLGGLTLFLFIVQVCTGLLLLLYYRPSAGEAFESVQYITSQVKYGWLIRSIHSWSANLMIFSAFAHMFSIVFLRAYRKPRELTWVSGMALLFLALGFGFSGYLLPWNTLAFFATKVGTSVPGQIPIVGHSIMLLMRGGEDVTGATLARFYGLHVAVLPLITFGMLGAHLLLVQKFGMSVPPSVENKYRGTPGRLREMRFFPNFLLRELVGWNLVLAVLLTLAVFLPWELGTKADPFASAPAGIRPEWYFLAQFQTLKMIPSKVMSMDGEVLGILAFGLAGGLCFALPFLETLLGRRGSLWVRVGAALGLAFLGSMTVYGHFAK